MPCPFREEESIGCHSTEVTIENELLKVNTENGTEVLCQKFMQSEKLRPHFMPSVCFSNKQKGI